MNDLPIVSIIVPTRNSSQFLEACLVSIKEQSYLYIELIVVDNNSTDNTKEIAKKYTDKVFNQGPERSAQRNFGAKQSIGEHYLIIDSDMELSKNVVTECVKKMTENNHSKALVIPEESFGEGFWSQCKKLERSFYIGVDWMEGARFFPKSVFQEFKGYDETNTGTEDYDLPQRIEDKYGKKVIGRINAFIYHNEQKISLWKTCGKKFYYAQKLDQYKSLEANKGKFNKQSSIFSRYALFLSQPVKLFKDPVVGLGMLFMKTSEFASGAAGYIRGSLK